MNNCSRDERMVTETFEVIKLSVSVRRHIPVLTMVSPTGVAYVPYAWGIGPEVFKAVGLKDETTEHDENSFNGWLVTMTGMWSKDVRLEKFQYRFIPTKFVGAVKKEDKL